MKTLADAKDLVCLPGHNYVYEAGMTAHPASWWTAATSARSSRRT